jgi:hypothetical protein
MTGWRVFISLGTLLGFCASVLFPPPLYAAYGRAERYDEFKEADLQEYHDRLLSTESLVESVSDPKQLAALQAKEASLKQLSGEDREDVEAQIEDLKQQLLQLPKRDRFAVQLSGGYVYDSNSNRDIPEQENDDSNFATDATLLFDLSGKKTDLRFEVAGGKQWSYEYPEKDSWVVEERLRVRRKYFKKISHAGHSKISRHNSKSIEINGEKIRWDSQQNQSFNYTMTRKLSINSEFASSQRYFAHETFDQDSSWDAMAAPSIFWSVTPKSRFAMGYQIATTKIRTKVGNANAHEIHMGYFGKVTRKSSMSLDVAFSHQQPKSLETATSNTVTTGIGYVLQMTAKTQGVLQLIRALQNTTSDSAGFNTDGVEQASKTDAHYANTSLSLSVNSRLTRKLTTVINFSASYFQSKVSKTGDEDTEAEQLSFPVGVSINYVLSRWVKLVAGYTFAYRMGNEKFDHFKAHIFNTAMNVTF